MLELPPEDFLHFHGQEVKLEPFRHHRFILNCLHVQIRLTCESKLLFHCASSFFDFFSARVYAGPAALPPPEHNAPEGTTAVISPILLAQSARKIATIRYLAFYFPAKGTNPKSLAGLSRTIFPMLSSSTPATNRRPINILRYSGPGGTHSMKASVLRIQ